MPKCPLFTFLIRLRNDFYNGLPERALQNSFLYTSTLIIVLHCSSLHITPHQSFHILSFLILCYLPSLYFSRIVLITMLKYSFHRFFLQNSKIYLYNPIQTTYIFLVLFNMCLCINLSSYLSNIEKSSLRVRQPVPLNNSQFFIG